MSKEDSIIRLEMGIAEMTQKMAIWDAQGVGSLHG